MFNKSLKELLAQNPKLEEFEGGIRAFLRESEKAIETKFPGQGAYVRDVVGDKIIFDLYSAEAGSTVETYKTYQISYNLTDKGGIDLNDDAKEIKIVEVIRTVQTESNADQDKKPKLLEEFDPEKFEVEEQEVNRENSDADRQLVGKIFLEQAPSGKSIDYAKGSVPLVKFGAVTKKGNRYFEEAWDWFSQDLKRITESQTSDTKQLLDMYPTHLPSLDKRHPFYYLYKSAVITGAEKENGVGLIHFETLPTQAGKDMAVLINKGFVNHVSLRAWPHAAYTSENEFGGDDVKRFKLEGADFTEVPSMPFAEDEKIKVEEKPEDRKMTLEELKEKQPDLYKKILEEGKSTAAEIKHKLEEAEKEKKAVQQKLEQIQRGEKKTKLLEEAKARIAENKNFGKTVHDQVAQSADSFLASLVEENPAIDEQLAKLKLEEFVKGEFAKHEAIIAEAQKSLMGNQAGFAMNVNLNTLGADQRIKGMIMEETGGSARIRDAILSRYFGRPVISDGKFLLEDQMPRLQPLVQLQHIWMDQFGRSTNDLFAPGGQIYESLLRPEISKHFAPLLESEETKIGNVGNTIGAANLPHEVADAIIFAAFPELLAMRIARTGDMLSTTKDIYEIGYPVGDEILRRNKHMFGFVDHAAETTLVVDGTALAVDTFGDFVDDGALSPANNQYGEVLYACLIEAPNDTMNVTFTGKDENNETMTWTVTFASTDSAGTIKRAVPSQIGAKCLDVTGVSATASLTSGQVGAFTQKPITGHNVGAQEDQSYLSIMKSIATSQDFDLGARLDINLLEDMQRAMAAGTGAALDYLGVLVQAIRTAIEAQVDKQLLYMIANEAQTEETYDNNVPSGYDQPGWDKKFRKYLDRTVDATALAGNVQPNWMVWSKANRSDYLDWLGNSFAKYNTQRTDLVMNSMSIGRVSGCEVYVTPNSPRNRIPVGSNQTGVHYYVYVPFVILGPQWVPGSNTKAVMVHHRAAMKITQSYTLGKLKVTPLSE